MLSTYLRADVAIGMWGKRPNALETALSCIKQHLPAKAERSTKLAISEHLIRNADCLGAFDNSSFSIVKKARTESVLHVLEALYIKGLRPELCKQMEFVKCLHLV